MSYPSDESLSNPVTIEVLRNTLKRLEENSELGDPMLTELKNTLLRAIGEIERRKSDCSTLV